ncbi:MAG: TadE/TadG family type IV pilus assembly protein [Planctomycetota bacterium]
MSRISRSNASIARRFGLRRTRREDRRGTASVEFALSASIVFFLFLGMIEVSRFHTLRHSLDQAVYMGARTGIVPGATHAEVEQVVRDRLSSGGVINPTVTITPSVIDSSTTEVTVRASTSYDQNSWTLPKFFSGVDVWSEITLDHENTVFTAGS